MPTVKEGDRVRIVTRPQTDEDVKSGLYYAHFGGLVGEVRKVYSKLEAVVDIEPESLTREVRRRHDEVRDQMKTRWLEGLSEEGRSRLTERERDFRLRFTVLVSPADLEKIKAPPAAVAPQPAPEPLPPAEGEGPPARKTSRDLDAAEEAELQRRRGKA